MGDMEALLAEQTETPLCARFRGFLPVVIDIETGGFDARNHALLEIAAVMLDMDDSGKLIRTDTIAHNIVPHRNTLCDDSALAFTGIDPTDPAREALGEAEALQNIFQVVRQRLRHHECTRAVVVAHNAHFDLGFINAAIERNSIKRNPFHQFSCFDTATLSGLAFGQTVLAKACSAAQIPFSPDLAHNAVYDAERTAELFCLIVNRWKDLGGWPDFDGRGAG